MTEAFKQGYMDKMAELRKLGEDNPDAGIGSLEDNTAWHPVSDWVNESPHWGGHKVPSYMDLLFRNAGSNSDARFGAVRSFPMYNKGDNSIRAGGYGPLLEGDADISAPMSVGDLKAVRAMQADNNARQFYPQGSVPYKRIYDNLIQAGQENLEDYLTTGEVTPRGEADLDGIEKLKLTPKQLDTLKRMQDSMAQNQMGRAAVTA